ncbi:hypothetical protein DDE18_11650 [Nocardioides gansuensis]|uniref:Uncharacterized protein n=1 Tax=Nocardioides gansuensis TaxID=2138300 RepID=A0A2T8FBB6_9ACTN|nr:hypothetical protein DDE18_11650 [Nocardioides gansuensis]
MRAWASTVCQAPTPTGTSARPAQAWPRGASGEESQTYAAPAVPPVACTATAADWVATESIRTTGPDAVPLAGGTRPTLRRPRGAAPGPRLMRTCGAEEAPKNESHGT